MWTRILVVDDERVVRWGLRKALEEAGYQVAEAATGAEALSAAAHELPDVVLLDYRLPDALGTDVLRDLHRLAPHVPVVFITGHASVTGAVEAMREGAYDYLEKPFEPEDVLRAVARAVEAHRLREEVARGRETAFREYGVESLVAESTPMKELLRMVDRVAASEASTVLLLGESGVGKGLVARAMHARSRHADKPFMHITCTALAENLLESELFGHERGAFTDARMQKKGLLELADGGTVFLDEIGDLSPNLQGKLLRFLEDRSFRRVGGVRDIRVSVRVIAATNKSLEREVGAGRFREDLFFRLDVIPIEIPPLRERRDDVLPLARHFVAHFNHEFNKSIEGLAREVEGAFQTHAWPGNVRELRNAIERGVLLADGPLLGPADLPSALRKEGSLPDGDFQIPTHGIDLQSLERDLVRQALAATQGNRTKAARLLGMNRDQIRYRIEKFDLEREQQDAAES